MNERKIKVSFVASDKINLNAIALAVANQIKNNKELNNNDNRTKVS